MVYIIGAGPGDEELLTLKAINAMKKCTAVLYDRLIGGNILNYLREDCEIYYCGKEPGCHYKTQEEINESIVRLAKEGHVVGRIKGGDPYVFGRGGEEALALIEEEIAFEVVPGITSAISVLNYAGIPVTSRGKAQSFHVITGMSASMLKVNWESLAKEEGTLIFLMGLESIEDICSNLIGHGKAKDSHCAVVMRGTTSKQKKVIGTLESISHKVKEAGLKSPCIIVVGDVVELQDKLSWYERKPLFGLNVCITRSKEQAEPLKWKLKDLGAEVTEINSINIVDTSENLKPVESKLPFYDYIVLTSVNAVNTFFNYLLRNSIDFRKIKGEFVVIGKATARALKERGIMPFLESKEFYSESLFEEIKPKLLKHHKVLIPCSKIARNYLQEEIAKCCEEVDRINIYETNEGHIKNPKSFEECDVIIFTSPSTVKNMISLVGLEKIKEKISIAIGPITNRELESHGIEAFMCKEASEEGLIEEIKSIRSKIND